MKKTYCAPQTEEFMINLEQGFLTGSLQTDDTGIPDLGFEDFTDIFAIF